MHEPLRISMFGKFSMQSGDAVIDDHSNRTKKVWLLLAYLIYTRRGRSTPENFYSLIQGAKSSEDIDDPASRLKALLYRARTQLDQLYGDAGHQLITRKGGTYAWNTEIPLILDVEEFDRLRNAPAETEDAQLENNLRALSLYQGDFLPKLSMEPWVMPISAYYHQQFLELAEKTLALLQQRQSWEEAIALCHQGMRIEPYSESLYQYLMRAMLATGDRSGVLSAYEQMSELLFDTFGVMPSDESRALYREASKLTNDKNVSISTVKDQLREEESAKGAMFCEYDFFRLLYQVQARAIIRSGDTIHIALLSLHGQGRKALPRRSLDTAAANLKELVIGNLRQGDVVSQCSMSQLVIMLPQANYENSCMVCERIIKAFQRQYPHSPAQIHYAVHPLEPKVPGAAAPAAP